MTTIDLRTPHREVYLGGILDLTTSDRGGLTERLPAWARAQLIDPAIGFVSSMPSGGRLEFETDSTTIEIEVVLTRIEWGGVVPHAASFDLVVDGDVVATESAARTDLIKFADRASTDFEVVHHDPSIIRFDGLPAHVKRVEVWLPQNATAILRGLRIDDGATISAPETSSRRRWVHYGSSISHGMEADHPTEVWPAVAARRAGVDLTSLGLAGQCHLDQFAARTIRDLDVDMISLKLGINVVNADSMRERAFAPAVHGLLDTIRDRHADTPIVVISPIICPAAETHAGPTLPTPDGEFEVVERPRELQLGALSLQRIRQLLETVVTQRRDSNLHYLHGHELFGGDDLDDLPDGLHPNSAGYRRMGERFWRFAFAGDGPFGSG